MTLTVRQASVTGATTAGRELTYSEMDANWAHVIQASNQTFTPSGTGAVSTDLQTRGRLEVFPADFGGTSPGSPSPSQRLAAQAGNLFYDDFLRANTSAGDLGTPPSGDAYTITTTRGACNISGCVWRSDVNSVMYAVQTLTQDVTRIGCMARWRLDTGATDQGTVAMIINPNGAPFAVADALHFTTTRTGYSVGFYSGSVLTQVVTGTYPTALTYDKWYVFELNLADQTVHYNLAGVVGSCDNAGFTSNTGPCATWEHFYNSADCINRVEVGAVWAGGVKQIPNFPMHGDSSGNIYANGQLHTLVSGNRRRWYSGGTSGTEWYNFAQSTQIALLDDNGYFHANRFYVSTTLFANLSGNTVSVFAGSTGLSFTASDGATVRMKIDANGNVSIGNAALATTATDGFLYIDSCAGAPTGTPTAITGRIPIVYDSTNNKLYAYNSAWKSVTLA